MDENKKRGFPVMIRTLAAPEGRCQHYKDGCLELPFYRLEIEVTGHITYLPLCKVHTQAWLDANHYAEVLPPNFVNIKIFVPIKVTA